MTQIVINGTSQADDINTGDLQKQYPYTGEYGYPSGFSVNGLDGDDTLSSMFIGRGGVDFLNGGNGDDFFAVSSYKSPLPIDNYVTIFGDYGTDRVYILPGNNLVSPITNEGSIIRFTVQDDSGSIVNVSVSDTVESISFGKENSDDTLNYLTEDLSKGILRAVSWDEEYFRTYNNNADWSIRGLDTYASYLNHLESQNTGPSQVEDSAAIVSSIGRLYTAAFGRRPDTSGLQYWVNQVNDPLISYKDVSRSFVNSPEFSVIASPNSSSNVFVTALYQNVLSRAPDSAGLSYWTNQFDSGLQDRADILIGFANSAENVALYETLA